MSNTDPSLSSVLITLPSNATVGSIYSFVLEAINNAGSVLSNARLVALSSLPAKPTDVPYSDSIYTNREQVKIMIKTFEFPQNGGSQILNYEIEYDDGNNGDFRSTLTLSPSILVSTGINL